MKSNESPAKYVITGITGQVGGAVARSLLAEDKPVRAVVRDAPMGAAGVFFLLPPTFDPSPGFPEARAQIEAAAGD